MATRQIPIRRAVRRAVVGKNENAEEEGPQMAAGLGAKLAVNRKRTALAVKETELPLKSAKLKVNDVNAAGTTATTRPVLGLKSNGVTAQSRLIAKPRAAADPGVKRVLVKPEPVAKPVSAIPVKEAKAAPKVVKAPVKAAKAEVPDDLDAEDDWDPMMVSEYVKDIYDYLGALEERVQPNPNYIETQKELEWKMRTILVDWLIEVHSKFHLLPETLFLAVNIIDRFLSKRVVSLVKLQLVGIVSLFVAAKYQEIMAPSVHNFIYMADNGYTEEEVLRAERYVLGVLEFNMSFPSPLDFLRRISKADQYDLATRTLAKYLMEIPLIDHRFLQYRWSQIAAAAMWFARLILERGEWNINLQHYSGYTEDELLPIVRLMHQHTLNPLMQEALYKKYANKKHMRASSMVRTWSAQNPSPEDIQPSRRR